MAERVAQSMAVTRGLTDVAFSSAGTSRDEIGNGIDPRAQRVLRQAGYWADGHHARQITADDIEHADLVVGMEPLHLDLMRRMAPDADNLVLMTDYDPEAEPGSGIDDPWWGPADKFGGTLAQIERAVSGLLDVQQLNG